jgi:hypothetical protein
MPEEKWYPGPPAWGSAVSLTTHSVKILIVEKSSKMPQKGLTTRRPSGYEVKDSTFGIWIVRTPCKTGALISLLSQLKTKNKMGERLPEGHVTNPKNRWMEESRRQRRMEASYEGDQGPEGAVAP